MSNVQITQIVVALAAIGSIGLFTWLVAIPSVSAREGFWDRLLAGVLSIYVFAVAAAVGVGAGIGIVLLWPRIS